VKTPEPFVDIHCHILPGLDDGASDRDVAIRMAEMAVADGIGTIVATPHQLGNFSRNQGAAIRAQAARFQQTLKERSIPLQILPGADVRIEPELVRKVRTGDVVSLADRRRHVLLELPHEIYAPLDRLLAELNAAGMVGILSHPERNLGILNQPAVLPQLVEHGCLLQVTAGSLLGLFGSRIRGFSESLIEQGLVHFIATDAHGTGSRPPLVRQAFQRVEELGGRELAVSLCCTNPASVAFGGNVTPGRQRGVVRSSWLSRLCHSVSHATTTTR
jgi:protein-tyrosine phosphatase